MGCGAVGRRLAHALSSAGEPVRGVVRSPDSAQALAEEGIETLVCNLDEESLPPGASAGEAVWYLVPPPAQGREDTRLQGFLAGLQNSGQPRRILLISTSGVYGDCGGDWVDETRVPNPRVDRAHRRLDAERRLLAWREASGGEAVIFRVAGIYGPGKLPLERLRRGLPMIAPEQAPWTNRIHLDDLVQACVLGMRHGRDGEIYNVSDGHPGNMADYFNRVADLAGLPRPPLIDPAEAGERLSAGLRSYLAESRRLRNDKLLRELGLVLRYPDLASGLAACFRDAGGS
ncbi:NAD-dependent epimerase/dehydratase [endosymbiont of unidentified scaly snail isolate Monju]|nr:NAD-dependent epimerase/dehydratase [endosymbiont of unidentified scaly snail isolate Monju]